MTLKQGRSCIVLTPLLSLHAETKTLYNKQYPAFMRSGGVLAVSVVFFVYEDAFNVCSLVIFHRKDCVTLVGNVHVIVIFT